MSKQPKMSQDLQAKVEAVRVAATWLESRHFAWIIGTALKSFVEKIDDLEARIVRHTLLAEDPTAGKAVGFAGKLVSREEEVASAKATIEQYRQIVAFLRTLDEAQTLASAEQFAAEIFGRGRQS